MGARQNTRDEAIEWACAIPGIPRTKGNHTKRVRRGNRVFSVQSDASAAAEQVVELWAAAHPPPRLLTGPLEVNVGFIFPLPRRNPEAHKDGDWCLRRVDRGNLLKLLEDAIQGIVYADDAQVVTGTVSKVWGVEPWTLVVVRELRR